MIKEGQIYSYKKIGNFVITNITEEKISRIWQDGSVDEIDINVYDGRMFGVLIAEFGSWQEAVCSNDFKEINGDQYEKIKELEKRLENLTNNYKLLKKKQAIDIADGQALVDGLGDFDDVREIEKKLKIAVERWIEEQADTSAQYDYDAEVILKNIVLDARETLKDIEK